MHIELTAKKSMYNSVYNELCKDVFAGICVILVTCEVSSEILYGSKYTAIF